jgi:DNA-binding NarL/FixJ family response regulator
VFRLVATGMLNKQAAFDLGITEKTIKVHHDREIHIICRSTQSA